ncbi:hypothetical protein [Occallatibacter savannae]|uniref:hypothetical protein n=1 Tax=Occallatibacter savannae TaxID=1002691 RepID=UPI000D69AC46|nr:hypothetical protein [Occallatibacter savannae]
MQSAVRTDLTFAHDWQAEVLAGRPPILPARHFVYPLQVEEVERGALEVLVRPSAGGDFLATCALGFKDPIVPTGIWSAPDPKEICAVAGGYAYMIDTSAPERFTMLPYRPVLNVYPAADANLLLFVGHRSILAWGAHGEAWQSPKLSDEGVTVNAIEGCTLHGLGWNLMTDKETPFALDLESGALRTP